MNRTSIEIAVGTFVLVGLFCIGYLTVHLGKMDLVGGNHYTLTARFQSVSGLKPGAQVEVAGVQIGQVGDIVLDPVQQVALVSLKIYSHVTLSNDAIASVKTAGLIGDKYIDITPGGSDEVLKPGEAIADTESALDMEELVSKYVFGDV